MFAGCAVSFVHACQRTLVYVHVFILDWGRLGSIYLTGRPWTSGKLEPTGLAGSSHHHGCARWRESGCTSCAWAKLTLLLHAQHHQPKFLCRGAVEGNDDIHEKRISKLWGSKIPKGTNKPVQENLENIFGAKCRLVTQRCLQNSFFTERLLAD